jgi:hypothetical protein
MNLTRLAAGLLHRASILPRAARGNAAGRVPPWSRLRGSSRGWGALISNRAGDAI